MFKIGVSNCTSLYNLLPLWVHNFCFMTIMLQQVNLTLEWTSLFCLDQSVSPNRWSKSFFQIVKCCMTVTYRTLGWAGSDEPTARARPQLCEGNRMEQDGPPPPCLFRYTAADMLSVPIRTWQLHRWEKYNNPFLMVESSDTWMWAVGGTSPSPQTKWEWHIPPQTVTEESVKTSRSDIASPREASPTSRSTDVERDTVRTLSCNACDPTSGELTTAVVGAQKAVQSQHQVAIGPRRVMIECGVTFPQTSTGQHFAAGGRVSLN